MSTSEIRAALEALDLRPSRKLGQNFLADTNISRAIVDLLDIGEGDTVVEIGPGLGALTDHIVGRARKVVLIEKDRRLAAYLRARFAEVPAVEIIEADAVNFDVRRFFADRPVKIISNLPYSAGGEIIRTFLGNPSPFQRAVFMLQKEVGERLCAVPRTKDYGVLTLRVQRRWVPRPAKIVPPDVFWPKPQVDSAVLILDPRDRSSLPAFDEALFDRLVRQGFSQRRKQLRKLLPEPPVPWVEVSGAAGAPETVRAEEIPLKDWVTLTNIYDDHPLKGEAQDGGELFDIVDGDDRVTGQAPRDQVHGKGLKHRAVHIFLTNKHDEIFLQKRSHLKDVHPGKWDSSSAGHLNAGEDYATCAHREIEEELGISPELEEIARIGACPETGWEFVSLYRASSDKRLRYPCSEIETGTFFPLEVVGKWVGNSPEDFATGFLECWKAFLACDTPPRTFG